MELERNTFFWKGLLSALDYEHSTGCSSTMEWFREKMSKNKWSGTQRAENKMCTPREITLCYQGLLLCRATKTRLACNVSSCSEGWLFPIWCFSDRETSEGEEEEKAYRRKWVLQLFWQRQWWCQLEEERCRLIPSGSSQNYTRQYFRFPKIVKASCSLWAAKRAQESLFLLLTILRELWPTLSLRLKSLRTSLSCLFDGMKETLSHSFLIVKRNAQENLTYISYSPQRLF